MKLYPPVLPRDSLFSTTIVTLYRKLSENFKSFESVAVEGRCGARIKRLACSLRLIFHLTSPHTSLLTRVANNGQHHHHSTLPLRRRMRTSPHAPRVTRAVTKNYTLPSSTDSNHISLLHATPQASSN